MNPSHCPLCYEELETREVAPCWECGALPHELEHARDGVHTYAEMRIFGDLTAVLCDFCQVDWGSRDPTYFGLPRSARIGFEHMQLVRHVGEVGIGVDKFCPHCGHRLAFLQFVASARAQHQHDDD